MMIIRAKTFKRWMEVNLSDYVEDIANHGCVNGFPGLTYYTDTAALYKRFSAEIWDVVTNMARDMGHANVFELLAACNGAKHVTGHETFANLMVWIVAEEYARQIMEEV